MTEKSMWADVLRHFEDQYRLSPLQAAEDLGINQTTYNFYRRTDNDRVPRRENRVLMLASLGFDSIEAAHRAIAANARIRVYPDFLTQSEKKFLRNFKTASLVYETRIMIPTPPGRLMGYRQQLNEEVRRRIWNGDLSLKRVEMITDLTRLAEMLINRDYFANAKDRYNVKLLPAMSSTINGTPGVPQRTVDWLPFMNFTVFDENAVMMGGFHNSSPDGEPFIEIHSEAHALKYYISYWNRLAGVAEQFSMSTMPMERVLRYARAIPGCADLQQQDLESKIQEVKQTMKAAPGVSSYTPRW